MLQEVWTLATRSKKICSIAGCNEEAMKSMSSQRIGPSVASCGLKVKDSRKRKTYLCKEHWKQVKKAYKKDTKGERMRWGP